MLLQPIDIKRAKAGFPSIFTVFGNGLDQQIDAFNKALGAGQVPSHLSTIVYGRMGAYGFANPHRPLLLALSALHAPGQFPPIGVAPVFLLEAGLAQSLSRGDKPSTYLTMLRSPASYSDLIGELDWVTQLRGAGATLEPHAPTPGQEGNFDINCDLAGHRLMGDVKWFQNWLVKPRGDNPLVGQIMLLQPDLAHEIIVKSRVRAYSQEYVLRAAEETLALYRDALGGTSTDRSYVVPGNPYTAAYARDPASRLVESVEVRTDRSYPAGKGHVFLVESEFPQSEDENAIYSNLLAAASQVPAAKGDAETACAMIGTAIPQSLDDVVACLFGSTTEDPETGQPVKTAGLFDAASQVPDLNHIDSVIFFSMYYESAGDDPSRVRVRRVCKAFLQPGHETTSRRAAVERVCTIYGNDSEVRVKGL
jgi:hypothetical protein